MAVKHIVFMKFKAETPQATLDQAKSNLLAMKGKVPGIIAISFGPTFKTDRAQGFTHALVVDLESKEGLEVYASHPEHAAVLTNDLKPNLDAPPCAMDYEYDL
mmetsp:Transcript_12337/g.24558  ORF Transcript_12337/g.24558 Transcript_12337/m.24558 type:complete len:103 (+) Transcript_12337:27-335(+)|eukprot:CAMPEP_0181309044 /NCGR_PEP_ID=MMETSP1101-20121128/11803_1 /TAXON_ID=46948 /ORGANISM="Rhodomonas abbreviata, Strain Caron Lab Isolate" /LENGTH=102 /DNA_ID=CAMNT_0023415501 /DNA_START=27 /DNA_END=335 /DNA_ORIENTATION=-